MANFLVEFANLGVWVVRLVGVYDSDGQYDCSHFQAASPRNEKKMSKTLEIPYKHYAKTVRKYFACRKKKRIFHSTYFRISIFLAHCVHSLSL